MAVTKQLIEKTKTSIKKGMDWLIQNADKITEIEDLSAHYKACYLYAASDQRDRARWYRDLLASKYIQRDGDFRTSQHRKGWEHIPSSPANRYIYSNGWIINGLQKIEAYGLIKSGLQFINRFQDQNLGGFYSRYDVQSGSIDKRYLDTSSTSSAGLALLSCGQFEKAQKAGDFVLRILDHQKDWNRFFFTSWEVGKGLMTDVFKEEETTAIRSRKNFCVSTEHNALYEMIWIIGMPIKFLCKLYDLTRERAYLDGTKELFSFFHKLSAERWQNAAGTKIMWGTSELYRHTENEEYKNTAERILEILLNRQHASGVWVHNLWYSSIEEQPFPATLDLVQEYISEFSDVIFDLSS